MNFKKRQILVSFALEILRGEGRGYRGNTHSIKSKVKYSLLLLTRKHFIDGLEEQQPPITVQISWTSGL